MHSVKFLGFGLAGLALAGVLGCCDTSGGGGSSTRCPVPPRPASIQDGCPPILKDSNVVLAPPIGSVKPAKAGPALCGEVRGDLVYNLGGGVISNSKAVLLAGGETGPRAMRVPGGVDARCNPVPDRYYETLKRNAANMPAPPPVFGAAKAVYTPAGSRPDPWSEPGVASSGAWCAPVACPVHPGSLEVCKPGENVSECFTLSDEELRAGPTVLIPIAGSPLMSAAPSAPEKVAAPAVETTKKTTAPDKYNGIAAKAETPALPVPPVAAVEPVKPEAPSAFPSGGDSGLGDLGVMPPLPMVSDIDDAVGAMDSVLSRDDRPASSLPSVELPPKLN